MKTENYLLFELKENGIDVRYNGISNIEAVGLMYLELKKIEYQYINYLQTDNNNDDKQERKE